jgi:hypothetical protein
MLTFSMLTSRVQDITGVITGNTTDTTNFQMDINQGLRLFKNASRRYWTRKEVSAALVANQQYYTFAADIVRGTEVRVNSSGLNFPVNQVDSEAMWNRINIIPAMTINLPMYYFIRGRNEIGLWPIPSTNVSAGLIVSYEARLPDMSQADTLLTSVGVTNNSQTVTSSSAFNTNMVGMSLSVTDGSDGNWYPIIAVPNTSTLTLENYYQGPTNANVPCTIGSVPDIPEDYQLGLVYFACYNFFLKRKDNDTATMYKALFEDLLTQYKETYAAKTTGQVQQSIEDYRYSIFTLPPNPIT